MGPKFCLVLLAVASAVYFSAARKEGPGATKLEVVDELPTSVARSLLQAGTQPVQPIQVLPFPVLPQPQPVFPQPQPLFPQPQPQPVFPQPQPVFPQPQPVFPQPQPVFPEPQPQPQPQPVFPQPQPQPVFPQPQPQPQVPFLCPAGSFMAYGPQGEVCLPEGILLPSDHSLFPPRDPQSVAYCPLGELYRPLSNGLYGCIPESIVYADTAAPPSPAPAGGEGGGK